MKRANFVRQLGILFRREITNVRRNKGLTRVRPSPFAWLLGAEELLAAPFSTQIASTRIEEILPERHEKPWVLHVISRPLGVAQTVLSALLFGFIFLQLERNMSSLQPRLFSSFLLIFGQFMFALLGVVNAFPAERAVFLRETQDKLYHPAAFYLAKVMIETRPPAVSSMSRTEMAQMSGPSVAF